ncbi:hypothetical protein HDV00_000505 [Rhizophlyctis rosea]|nr:hypothetical protein HDV00_000505 [Rhizophlyctis rosea]
MQAEVTLAYTTPVLTDLIHGFTATVEEVYLPKAGHVVNNYRGQLSVFKSEGGPRVLRSVQMGEAPVPAEKLSVVKVPEEVQRAVEEFERCKGFLKGFLNGLGGGGEGGA